MRGKINFIKKLTAIFLALIMMCSVIPDNGLVYTVSAEEGEVPVEAEPIAEEPADQGTQEEPSTNESSENVELPGNQSENEASQGNTSASNESGSENTKEETKEGESGEGTVVTPTPQAEEPKDDEQVSVSINGLSEKLYVGTEYTLSVNVEGIKGDYDCEWTLDDKQAAKGSSFSISPAEKDFGSVHTVTVKVIENDKVVASASGTYTVVKKLTDFEGKTITTPVYIDDYANEQYKFPVVTLPDQDEAGSYSVESKCEIKKDGNVQETKEISTEIDENNVLTVTLSSVGDYTIVVKCTANENNKADINEISAAYTFTVKDKVTVELSNEIKISKISDGTSGLTYDDAEKIKENVKVQNGSSFDSINQAVVDNEKIDVENAGWQYAGMVPGKSISITGIDAGDFPLRDNNYVEYYEVSLDEKLTALTGKIEANPANDLDLTEGEGTSPAWEIISADETVTRVSAADGVIYNEGWFGPGEIGDSEIRNNLVNVEEGSLVEITDQGEAAPVTIDGDSAIIKGKKIENIYLQKDNVYYGPFSIKYNYDAAKPEFAGAQINDVSIKDITEDGAIIVKDKDVMVNYITPTNEKEQSGFDDTLSGICASEKKVEDASSLTFSNEDTITIKALEKGKAKKYYIYIKLADKVGNVNYVLLDKEILSDHKDPSVSITGFEGNNTGKVQINLKANDEDSGLSSVTAYLYDAGNKVSNKALQVNESEKKQEFTITVSDEDASTFKAHGSKLKCLFVVTDRAGNVIGIDQNGTIYKTDKDEETAESVISKFEQRVSEKTFTVCGSYALNIGFDQNEEVIREGTYIYPGRTEVYLGTDDEFYLSSENYSYKINDQEGTVSGEYDTKEHAYKYTRQTIELNKDGNNTFKVSPENEYDKVTGLGKWASDQEGSFICDNTEPVVKIEYNDCTGVSDNTFFYGLKNGYGEKGTDIEATISVNEDNWYEEDIPTVFINKGQDKSIKWTKEKDSHVCRVKIDYSEGDGEYKITLKGHGGKGDYYNYSNINNVLKAKEDESSEGLGRTNVIDTERPEAEYDITCDGSRFMTDPVEGGKYEINPHTADEKDYFKDNFSVSFKVDDDNFSAKKISADAIFENIDNVWTANIENEGEYTFRISGTDKAGNLLTYKAKARSGNISEADKEKIADIKEDTDIFETIPKILDKTSPKLSFTAEEETNKKSSSEALREANKTIYYNDPYKITAKIDEEKIKVKASDSLQLKEASAAAELFEGKTITVNNDGDISYVISAFDYAGNLVESDAEKTIAKYDCDDKLTIALGEFKEGTFRTDITLDRKEPAFRSTSTSVNDINVNVDSKLSSYFNKDIDVVFTVDEPNLNEDKTWAGYAYSSEGDYESAAPEWNNDAIVKADGTKTYAISIPAAENMQGVYRFEIRGFDKAGNPLVKASDEDSGKADYAKIVPHGEGTGEWWSYNHVMDITAPKADLHIFSPSGGEEIYTGRISNNNLMLSLAKPYQNTTSANGHIDKDDKSPVVLDYTLCSSISNEKHYSTGYDYESSGFSLSGEQMFWLQGIEMKDRAGNICGGVTTNKIYLDVKPPRVDKLAPITKIVARNTSVHGKSGEPLFNSDVTFEIAVSDPGFTVGEGNRSSGINEVSYQIYNGGTASKPVSLKAADYVTGSDAQKNGKYDDVPLVGIVTGIGEAKAEFNNSNDLKIVVTASDHAGNISVQEYEFGIDTTAPKINVTYDNNSAQNGKYFKNNRTATIVVTERNFDAGLISINTNGGSQSGWSHNNNGGNGDQDTWTKTITYSSDGDYTFSMSGRDMLGHSGSVTYNGTAPQEFTVDKTVPVITITFDNNNSYKDSKYFNAARIATVTIVEHNFRASDANVETTASIARGEQPVVAIGNWGGSGDNHYLNADFKMDGDYTIKANFTDLAGNVALEAAAPEFTVDQTKPEIKFDEDTVKDKEAYQGEISPRLIFSDTNYDPAGVTFNLETIKGMTGKKLNLEQVLDDGTGFGGTISYENFEVIKANDDVYSATGKVIDRAGNENEVSIKFSVNRFGSTFDYNDDKSTEELMERFYTNNAGDVYLREINVNKLVSNDVYMTHDTEYVKLVEGEDYEIRKAGRAENSSGWQEYIYKFFGDNFEEEGTYNIVVQSKDEAGNNNTNASIKGDNDKETTVPVEFVVDTTKPYTETVGIDISKKRYFSSSLEVNLNLKDNIETVRVEIYLDDVLQEELEGQELADALSENGGTLPFVIPGKNKPQILKVVTYDAAGNRSDEFTYKVQVTRNVFAQWFYNTPLFIFTLILLAAAAILMVLRKKRKDEEKQKRQERLNRINRG